MMSYSPATKLSYSNGQQRATVLTEGNVMVTMADGAAWRQMMRLEDWLILADGQKIQEEFIPLPKEGAVRSAVGGEFIPLPKAEAAGRHAAAAQVYDVGTKLKWKKDDNTFRVAIVTGKGVLQVKSMTPDSLEYTRKMFPTAEAWIATLPGQEGNISVTRPDITTSVQKRLEEPLPATLSDVAKVGALMKRFKVLSGVYQEASFLEKYEGTAQHADHCIKTLDKMPADYEKKFPDFRERYTRNLKALQADLERQEQKMAGMTYAEKSYKPLQFYHRGSSALFATIRGVKTPIYAFGGNHKARYEYDSIVTLDGKEWLSFDEMGVDKKPNGQPMLSVRYRRKNFDL